MKSDDVNKGVGMKNKGIRLGKKEFASVVSSINTYFYARFKGKRKGFIAHGDYSYRFKINDFNEGKAIIKYLIENPNAQTDDVIDFIDEYEGISY